VKTKSGVLFFALTVLFLCTAHSSRGTSHAAPAAEAKKVIIDTDPGTDDAMAILLALNSPELDVKAVTVVPGNVPGKLGLENALKLVSLANRCDIPVAGGAQKPLFQQLISGEYWHGKNGLGNVEPPPSRCHADPRFGPDLIIEMVHAMPHQITLVPVGPLTNIALAVEKDPTLASLVKEVVIMGGSITGGNSTASAEANIYGDPEAAQIVFQAGWKLTMATLGVGNKTLFTRKHLEQLSRTHGPENDFAVQVLNHQIAFAQQNGWGGMPMYDPVAVGATIDPALLKTEFWHVDVETRGEFTRGETVANRQNRIERDVWRGDRYVFEGFDPVPPNAHVSVDVDGERFLQLFISRLSGK
jgi:inosine-uridine nucleoside N-ribohydrolase